MGETLDVQGTVTGIAEGQALVTFEAERSSIPWELEPVPDSGPEREEVLHANYEKANNKVILSAEVDVVDHAFQTSFDVPVDLVFGDYYIKVMAQDDAVDAITSMQFTVVQNP